MSESRDIPTHVIVTNSNFTNNYGTPLKFKADQLGESLLFGGYNTFSNNTGVFGGACNLQNILLETNVSLFQGKGFYTAGTCRYGPCIGCLNKGTVIFENNKGIYGGALYLANIILQ